MQLFGMNTLGQIERSEVINRINANHEQAITKVHDAYNFSILEKAFVVNDSHLESQVRALTFKLDITDQNVSIEFEKIEEEEKSKFKL